MNIQTIFPIVFVAITMWVVLIWAVVIAVFIRNIIVAVKNRGKNDEDGTTTAPTTTPTDMPTIAGMPVGAYYATHATQITTPTNTFNHTTPTIY